MSAMADLSELREQIDSIDNAIFELFTQRAELAEQIAAAKSRDGRAVYDPERERAKVLDARSKVPSDLQDEGERLMELLMESSRKRQNELLGQERDR